MFRNFPDFFRDLSKITPSSEGPLFLTEHISTVIARRCPTRRGNPHPFLASPYLGRDRVQGEDHQGLPLLWNLLHQIEMATLTGGHFYLVEARGVEPLSESTSTTLSPGADGNLHSLLRTSAVKDPNSVASLVPGAGKAYCTHVRY